MTDTRSPSHSARPRSRRPLAVAAALASAALLGGALVLDPAGLRAPRVSTPADVLPASTSDVVQFDAEPDLLQAAEMAGFVSRVRPARELLGGTAGPDLRQQLWAAIAGPCKDVDHAREVDPWLGRHVALAHVGADRDPVWVLQVDDEHAARRGASTLADCGLLPHGAAFRDGFLLLADSDQSARDLVEQGRTHPLAQRAEYVEDTARTAQAGLVRWWTTKQRFVEQAGHHDVRRFGALAPRLLDEAVAADWRSASAVLRINAGVPEVKVAVKTTRPHRTSTTEMGLASMPPDTVLGFGISDGDELVADHWPGLQALLGRLGMDPAPAAARFGLDLPADASTVLGKDLRVSFAAAPGARRLEDLPLQVQSMGRKRTSPDAVEEVFQRSGLADQGWQTTRRKRTVALSRDAEQAGRAMRSRQRLTRDATFRDAYPKPEQGQIGLYANLQSLGQVASDAAPPALKPWAASLGAVGANAHNEDANYTVGRLRVTERR